LEHGPIFKGASGEHLAVLDDGVGPEALRCGEVADDTRNAFMLLAKGFLQVVHLINTEFMNSSFVEE
jgi:hypothetical protein